MEGAAPSSDATRRPYLLRGRKKQKVGHPPRKTYGMFREEDSSDTADDSQPEQPPATNLLPSQPGHQHHEQMQTHQSLECEIPTGNPGTYIELQSTKSTILKEQVSQNIASLPTELVANTKDEEIQALRATIKTLQKGEKASTREIKSMKKALKQARTTTNSHKAMWRGAKKELRKTKSRFVKTMLKVENKCRKEAELITRTLQEGMTKYIAEATEEFLELGDNSDLDDDEEEDELDEDEVDDGFRWAEKEMTRQRRVIDGYQEGGISVIDKIQENHDFLMTNVDQMFDQLAEDVEKMQKKAMGE